MGDGAEVRVLKGKIIVKEIRFSGSKLLGSPSQDGGKSFLLSGIVRTFRRLQREAIK